MAAAEVLALPELLENILGHLDMKTLLLSQRVNNQFKSVIRSSKHLQEKLYLRLKSSTDAVEKVTRNPLLIEPNDMWSEHDEVTMCLTSAAVVLENVSLKEKTTWSTRLKDHVSYQANP
ncbi:hypothetical protein LTR95_012167 [Oleoguttula sp. CCFEE 5521]